MDLETSPTPAPGRPFEARYVAFLETIANLRPSLHRYCSRMTGSVLDGEDVVQEALFQAYRMLETFDDNRPLAPWLFRIAHNRCIDHLRRRAVRKGAELAVTEGEEPDRVLPVDPPGAALGRAVEHLVLSLPPKERACVLLKDVFDYSLEEIAELVGSTVGGVKAALNRGRSKLPTAPVASPPRPPRKAKSADEARLLHLYVERFNRRDWDGVRELIAADARLRVADRFLGTVAESPYFGNYVKWPHPWRLAVGEVDGEAVVIILGHAGKPGEEGWAPHAMVRLEVEAQRVTGISDYIHCPWMLASAASVAAEPSWPN
jgi:RNA polymerase sigma-70 factor (ECF subfamily)